MKLNKYITTLILCFLMIFSAPVNALAVGETAVSENFTAESLAELENADFDFSEDIHKQAVFNELYPEEEWFMVFDSEPYPLCDTMVYQKSEFSEDTIFEVTAYKVVTDTYDIIDETTNEVTGQKSEQTLWYQVDVICGEADAFESGYWIMQNYLNEEDVLPENVLTLMDAVQPEEPGMTVSERFPVTLFEEHGTYKEYTIEDLDLVIDQDSVNLYDSYGIDVYGVQISDASGIEVTAYKEIVFADGFVLYQFAYDGDDSVFRAVTETYPFISAEDVSEKIDTEMHPCAICGKLGCTIAHLYCEICREFDCGQTHISEPAPTPDFVPTIPENPELVEGEDVTVVDAEGHAVSGTGIQLYEGVKQSFSAWSGLEAEGNVSYQWQICYDVQNDLWTDIWNQTGQGILVSPAMVEGIRQVADTVQIRCRISSGDSVLYSSTIPVTVVSAEPASAARFGLARTGSDAAVYAETPELKEYTVLINYVFEDNTIVGEPYSATLAAGSSFAAAVPHPNVMGYQPYVGEDAEPSTLINLDITDIQEDITYTVTYKPANVDYTVIHYQQNVNDDNYTIALRESKSGLTNTMVSDVAKSYEGFYALLYERPAIAADGSTVVEIYYDRNYYLMTYNQEGGYGAEAIYARYGTDVSAASEFEMIRAGYTFTGWMDDETEIFYTVGTFPYSEMPGYNTSFTAQWRANDLAKVSIIIWGENADDENYSYIKTGEFYAKPGETVSFQTGNIACGYDEEHTHTSDCYNCGKEEHTHDAACCTLEEHSHSASCCTVEIHTHSKSCYGSSYVVGDQTSVSNPPSSPVDGTIAKRSGNNKAIYIGGKWYRYYGGLSIGSVAPTNCGKTIHSHSSGTCVYCDNTEHTHGDGNCVYCSTPEHVHIESCFTCTKDQHQHSSSCYITSPNMDGSLWRLVGSDSVTVAADGSTVMNVYYDRTTFTLTFRDGGTVATITNKWGALISDEFEKAPFNTTYNGRAWQCTETSKYGYALQTLDRMPQFDAKFNLYNKSSQTLKTIYYYVENVGANVSPSTWPNGTSNFTLLKEVATYFNYATYEEEYHEIEGFTRYSKSVSGFSNNQKNFSNNKLNLYYMRNSYDLTFHDGYNVVRDSDSVEYQAPLSAYTSYVPDAPDAYEVGSVTFGGWYLNPECTGAEFVLNEQTMPLGNLILYAKWVPVEHTVSFYLDYDAYRNGAKLETHPDVTVLHREKLEDVPAVPVNGDYKFVAWFYMDNGVEKAFDFANMAVTKDMQVYGKWSSDVLMQYYVYFKIKDTDIEIAEPVTGSALAGTTKTFDAKGGSDLYTAYQSGYFPVAKSHSMTLDIENEANNIYTFWYVQKDAVPYTVYYVTEDPNDKMAVTVTLDGKRYYLIAETKEVSDNHQAVVTEKFEAVSGYMPDAYQKRLVVNADNASENKIIFIYSKDVEHAYYKITHYTQNLDGETWTEYTSSQIVGTIGQTYTADPLSIDGFTYDSDAEGSLVSGELTADGLELKLYYVRNTYPYEIRYLEQGTGKTLAEPKKGTGKYGQVISESAVDITDYMAVNPVSQAMTIKIEESGTDAKLNIITFYYVKAYADLTIVKEGWNPLDENQSFIFTVTGNGVELDVVIGASGRVTIKDLKVGQYTITEKTEWSWRYTPDAKTKTITLTAGGENKVTFKNTRSMIYWLSGDCIAQNWWGSGSSINQPIARKEDE